MDEMVWLRLAHIVPGVFWVGATIFLALFLEPALQRLGPSVQGPVMAAVGRTAGPVLTVAGLMTVGFGFVLASRTPGRDMSQLFANNWGWAIGLGAIAGVVALLGGLTQGATAGRIGKIMQRANGGAPTPADAAHLAELGDRISLIGRLEAVLVTLAVALMASARYI